MVCLRTPGSVMRFDEGYAVHMHAHGLGRSASEMRRLLTDKKK